MGDFRLNVDISVTGRDGKEQKIDWWVNWYPTQPAKIYEAIVEMAEKAGLDVDYSEVYGGSHLFDNKHIDYLEEKIEKLEARVVEMATTID